MPLLVAHLNFCVLVNTNVNTMGYWEVGQHKIGVEQKQRIEHFRYWFNAFENSIHSDLLCPPVKSNQHKNLLISVGVTKYTGCIHGKTPCP